jgi:hypothetical protein
VTERAIRSALATDPPTTFRTEVLCEQVDVLSKAVDGSAWLACADPAGGVSAGRPVIVVEKAAGVFVVVVVSATRLMDDRVRVSVVGVWPNADAAEGGLRELRDALRPLAMGWFPKGPGAVLGAVLRSLSGSPIRGASVPEAHMTFTEYVESRRVLHADDPVLNAAVMKAGTVGGAAEWMFDRGPGETHAVWAAAGALHLALANPRQQPRRRALLT